MYDVENSSELIIYQTDDGKIQINLKAIDGTVWLTQKEIAGLFDRDIRTINEHLKTIFTDNELDEIAVIRKFRITATDGKNYDVVHYNLDAILAIGYRVRSPRGMQFRKWATTVLKEYLIKGFAMDDNRLKQSQQWDYFDEWLARIREIRTSEKRFYQKIKELYSTAIDYNKDSEQAKLFFKKVQNKILWAITGQTAAEIIANRSNPALPNMGLTCWIGSKVRKIDIDIAKNYLLQQEIDELNHVVTMYLDYAEDQANKRKIITMSEWERKLDAFLTFNERELLTHAGSIRAAVARQLANDRYDKFDAKRKEQELQQANEEDMQELEQIAEQLIKGSTNGK